MAIKTIYITTFDLERLTDLIEAYRNSEFQKKVPIDKLEKELERAQIVDPKSVPPDVITMNSTAHLQDLKTGEEIVYTLVFPKDSNVEQHKISVMAPIGMALIGYRVGDVIEWQVPGGVRRLKIIKTIFQPEASGQYHL